MKVKWHGVMSETKLLRGGGAQGSSWGVLSYLSQSNNNADHVPEEDRYKFVDDLTIISLVNLATAKLETYNVKDHVPNHIPTHNTIIKCENLDTQEHLHQINEWTKENKMLLNVKKTDYMIINFTHNKQFVTDINIDGQHLNCVTEKKLLGVTVTSDLKWDKNVELMTKQANINMRYLHSARKFCHDTKILKQIYLTWIRNNVEFGAVVWHSSLTQELDLKIERIQKAAVRVIMGERYTSYDEALGKLKLDKLSERRRKICLRFAKNSLKLKQFSNLFPVNENAHIMVKRNGNRYVTKKHLTERYKMSTVPYLQRLLNEDFKEKKKNFQKIIRSVPVDNNVCYTAGKF